jgi:hypothetical protein
MEGIGRGHHYVCEAKPYAERTSESPSWCNLPIPCTVRWLRALPYIREARSAAAQVATFGSAMNRDSAPGATAVDEAPEWWQPYAPEFPHWHVWRGVAGLFYARRPRSSPPRVVRGKDLTTLRERIINADAVR